MDKLVGFIFAAAMLFFALCLLVFCISLFASPAHHLAYKIVWGGYFSLSAVALGTFAVVLVRDLWRW